MPRINKSDVAEIQQWLEKYRMAIIHADGVYRHLRFNSTAELWPGHCHFDVVTWPGHAWIGGDWCDGYTIKCGGELAINREPDMLHEFLNVKSVDYDYWAVEMKRAAHSQKLSDPSSIVCNSMIDEWINEIRSARDLAGEDELTDTDVDTIRGA